jgi:hypothetical protein
MTTETMPILDARPRGEAPKRTPPENPKTLRKHSGLFSPIPENLPDEPIVRWSWIFETAIHSRCSRFSLSEFDAGSSSVPSFDPLEQDRREVALAGIRQADVFCRMMRRRIHDAFAAIRSNDDVRKYRTARRVLDGQHQWLERGLAPMAGFEELGARPPEDARRPVAAV